MVKAVLIACCLVAVGGAQDSAPTSRASSEYTLDSGLRVRIVPVNLPDEIAVILAIHGAGIMAEPAGIPHLAHLSEHTIFYSQREEAARTLVERWFSEGLANAETLPELMYFDLYPERGRLGEALRIQASRLRDPRFDPLILRREKPVALSEVTGVEAGRTGRSDFLGKFAWSAFVQTAFHGVADVPFRSRTEAISLGEVQSFYDRTFSSHQAMLTIVGDVDPAQTKIELTGAFKQPRESRRLAESRPALRPGSLKGSWDVTSHQFFMAWPVPAPSDPEHPALSVLAQILNVRLSMTAPIRKLGIQAPLANADLGGLFVIQMPLQAKDGGDRVAAELRRVLDGLAQDEAGLRALKTFKTTVRATAGLGPIHYPPRLPRRIIAHATRELWRMRATLAFGQSPEDYCARTDAVTADDIRAAIKKYLTPEKATIVTIAGKE